jgi:plasmid stability protein
MARFVVRNIEKEVKARLQRRARRNGRSMEAEVRDILRDAVKEEVFAGGLGTEITSLFSKIGLAETEHIPELRGFKIRPLLFKR